MIVQQILLMSVVSEDAKDENDTLYMVKLVPFEIECTTGSPSTVPAGPQFVSWMMLFVVTADVVTVVPPDEPFSVTEPSQ